MKVALCLFGIVGSAQGQHGKGYPLVPDIGYEYYKKNLLDKYDVDVFIHSWSTEFKDKLIELYNPKLYIIEEQKNFNPIYLMLCQIKHLKFGLRMLRAKKKGFLKDLYYVSKFAMSRWYSTKQSLNLKKQFEINSGIEYDCVISARFDIALLKPLDLKLFDMRYINVAHRRRLVHYDYYMTYNKNYIRDYDEALEDLWLFSNSSNMDKIATLYDNMNKYIYASPWSILQHIKSENLSYQYIDYEIGRDWNLLRWFYFFR